MALPLFLSHILTFAAAELEKAYQLPRFLRPLLNPPKDRLPTEVVDEIDVESCKVGQTAGGKIALVGQDGRLDPISAIGTGQVKEEDTVPPASRKRGLRKGHGSHVGNGQS